MRLPVLSAVATTMGDAAKGSLDAGSRSPGGWILLPQAIGVMARVAVWSGIFSLLIFGLFTFPALVVGAFIFVVFFARSVRRTRS